ncbi:MAG: methionine--tRNA ligase [bacterium]|nr:methionine--tRNA ligase [bacterium]
MAHKFYITTAIPYMNGTPHAGHALEIIQTDALARMWRMAGYQVTFQTGSDDHGMKNRNTAQKEGLEVRTFIQKNISSFLELYKKLDISHTHFLSTSDETSHYPGAKLMWEKLAAAGDIYKKSYQGRYCEGCESMKVDKDLIDGKCPDHPTKQLQEISEENYFFRLSKYKEQVIKLIREDAYLIEPEIRKNEILAFLEKAEDVSFSRQKSKMPRGVPVPGDPEHVMYVWCDALTNYLTGQGFGHNEQRKHIRPADIHVIGKDILRFHAAFWPAMLLSAQLPLPKVLLAHGHLTLNGEKMSKSTGNVIDPSEIVDQYGRDAFVFNLLYDVSLNADGDFSLQRLANVYNSMLI